MAAFPNSPQLAPETPKIVKDPAPQPRNKGPVFFIVFLLIAGAVWYFRPQQQKTSKPILVPTVKVHHGSIASTRRIAGSITAARFSNITVPILQAPETGRGMTITFLASSGSFVKKGDLLIEIDSQDMRDHLDDVEAMVVQADLDNKKKRTVQVAQMEALQQRVRSARADLLKSKEDLKAIEVRSEIMKETLKLAVEEYQAAYDELLTEVPLMEERLRADMAISVVAYDQLLRHRNRHRHDIDKCRVIAPIDGMAVVQTTTRNGELTQIQVGERVYPGQPVMRVVDPSSMMLDALMSQTEAELIRLGQGATVHFDAFPDIVLPGKVRSVGALAFSSRRQSYYIRRIPVQVTIDSRDSRVIPDLSASADVTTNAAEGLILPREAVAEEAGKNVVYVRQEAGFAPREVSIAGESNTQVAIAGGLSEGDEIAAAAHSVVNQ